VDEAALSWYLQPGNTVVAAVTPADIVVRYEAAFVGANLHPGLVTCTPLALIELLPATGYILAAHLTRGALSLLALRNGVLILARTLELDHPDDLSTDLFPTLVYLEDQTGARPDQVLLLGFGGDGESSATRLSVELDIPVSAIDEPHPGLAGYLRSLALGDAPVRPEPVRTEKAA